MHAYVCTNKHTSILYTGCCCGLSHTHTAICRHAHVLKPAVSMVSSYCTVVVGSIPCCVFSTGCTGTLKLTGRECPPAVRHCMSATLKTVSDTPPPVLSTANHLTLSATSPGILHRIQDLTESPTANLFNSFCPTLVPTSRLYFTLSFNYQLTLLCASLLQ